MELLVIQLLPLECWDYRCAVYVELCEGRDGSMACVHHASILPTMPLPQHKDFFFLFVLFCNLLRAEDGSQGLFCVRQVLYY